MTGHWDAALFGAILFIAFLILLMLTARAHRKQIARVRGQRDRLRDERDTLREKLADLREDTARATRKRLARGGVVRTPLTDVYALEHTVADVVGPYAPGFYAGGVA